MKSVAVIRHAVLGGAAWMFATSLIGKLVAMVTQVFLGWTVDASLFGVAASINVAVSFAVVGASPGLDTVLMQRGLRARLWLPYAMIVPLVFGALSATLAAIALFAMGVDRVHSDAGLMILIAGVGVFPTAFLGLLSAAHRARLDFVFVAKVSCVTQMLGGLVCCGLAEMRMASMALMVPSLAVASASAVVLARSMGAVSLIREARLRAGGMRKIGALLRESRMAGLSKLLSVLVANIDYMVVGFCFGPRDLGVYYYAYGIAIQPLRLIGTSVANLSLPALVAVGAQSGMQAAMAHRAVRLIVPLMSCVGGVQFIVTRPLIEALFGDKWNEAIPIVQILSLAFAVDCASWVGGALLQARRMYSTQLVSQVLLTAAMVGLLIVGSLLGGLIGAAVGVALYHGLCGLAWNGWAFSVCGASARRAVWDAGIGVGSAVAAVAASYFAMLGLESVCSVSAVPHLGLQVLTFLSAFAMLLAVIAPGHYTEIKLLLIDKTRR